MRNTPDQQAQKLGFANAKTLHTAIQLGQHLRTGKAITNAQVDQLAAAYPAVPKSVIMERAIQVNGLAPSERFAAFAEAIGGRSSIEQATALVDNYAASLQRESTVDSISDRLDARQPERAKAMVVPVVDHRSELRRSLESQFKTPMPANIETARRIVADGAERNMKTLADPKASMRDVVAAAFDKPIVESAIDECLTDADRDAVQASAVDDQWVMT